MSDTLIARGILDKSQPQTIRSERKKDTYNRVLNRYRVVRETSELVKIHSSKQKEKSFHFEFKGLVGTERVTFLNDTGCSTMVVGKDTLKRLNLPFQPRKVAPILVEYGNLQTETISEEISLAISIGNYFRKWTFYVADIGDMIILGNPFQDSIHVTDQLAKEGRYGFLDLYTQEPHCGLWKVTKRRLNYHASIPQLKLSRRKNFTNDSCTRGHVTIRLLSEEKNLPAANEPAEDPQITALLHEYAARFAEPKELPPERPGLDMEINLQPNSEIPKWRSIGKFNEAELEQLKRQIREMLERGHIRPSTSPFAASVLFAKKADGGLRMCIDYRGLNEVTIKNRAPIPNIVELRERLKGAKVFSKCDLREGFYNLQVIERDRHKTAFRCRYGHFEFNVVPMGLSNSPGVFQALMNDKFRELLDICVIIYLDDIVIYSENLKDHIEDLKKVFKIFEQERFMVKRSKCTFLAK